MRIVHKNKKSLFIISLLVILAIGSTLVWWHLGTQREESITPSEDRTINYGPPSENERRAGDEIKQEIVKQSESDIAPSNSRESVGVAVTTAEQYGSQVEVRAFIQGVIEGGGTCTATFKKDGHTITSSSEAFIDATTSQCKPIFTDRGEFPSGGGWALTVSYDSKGYTGASEVINVAIR